MIASTLTDLGHGFGVAFMPTNLLWCFVGVLIGNVVGVLPGLGISATISILLPLTFGLPPVAAILMLAGIYYGAQYGGAICSILLNLPCHPPHAVTCLDGYPLTKQGKGGTALAITMMSSFVGASFGITLMIFFAPLLVRSAQNFGPAEICSIMLLGLLAGSTLAKGSAVKGVAMTVLGFVCGMVGTDVDSGALRFTFGNYHLYDGIEIITLALGVFGIAEFLRTVNQVGDIDTSYVNVRMRDMRPSMADIRISFLPMVRGTLIGTFCSMIPGTGPTIASFVSYAVEKKISKTPERFGNGALEGVACPEAATHSAVQGDFIPTMSLGIPGDSVMALLLGALMIQGIVPGPQLIKEHPDIFWGLIASFWIGNILLVVLNVPMIGIWVKLLKIPYKYLFPCALFFVCIGVYSINDGFFEVIETLVIGLLGYLLLALGFHPAPVLLGFVLGPQFEEDFRRAMVMSHGDLTVFLRSPLSATFLGFSCVLVLAQCFFAYRSRRHVGFRAAVEPPTPATTIRTPAAATTSSTKQHELLSAALEDP